MEFLLLAGAGVYFFRRNFKKNLILKNLILILIIFTNNILTVSKKKTIAIASKTNNFLNFAKTNKNIIHVAIVGSGPAGKSAAIAASRFGYHVVLFEGPRPGGWAANATLMENFPGSPYSKGSDIVKVLDKQAKKFGTIFDDSTVSNIDFSSRPFKITTNEGVDVWAYSVIIATGAIPKKLGVKGEDEYFDKGLAVCSLCDAPLTFGEKTIVVGSNDIAIEQMVQLSPYASSITMITKTPTMEAAVAKQKKLDAYPEIVKLFNSEIIEIVGNGNHVEGVRLRNNSTGMEYFLEAQWVFLSIGYEPDISLIKNKLEFKQNGVLKLFDQNGERTQKTSVDGVFGAGIIADERYRQAGTSSGFGQMAGLDAAKDLNSVGVNELIGKYSENLYKPFEKDKFQKSLFKVPTLKSEGDLASIITRSRTAVLVEIFSPFCQTCKNMENIVDSTVSEFTGKLKAYRLDRSNFKQFVKDLNIKTVPYFMILKNGDVVDSKSGQLSRSQLRDFIRSNV